MPKTTVKYPRVGARVSERLRTRVDTAIEKTNQSEAAITRTALEEFFLKYKSPAQIIAAVIESVRRGE